jgi:hypothetical protein
MGECNAGGLFSTRFLQLIELGDTLLPRFPPSLTRPEPKSKNVDCTIRKFFQLILLEWLANASKPTAAISQHQFA